MLRAIGNALKAAFSAVLGCALWTVTLPFRLLGPGAPPRPTAEMMTEPPASPANPVADVTVDLNRLATKIMRWAALCIRRGRTQLPDGLSPDVALWAGNLTRAELILLLNSDHRGVVSHLSGACPLGGVTPVGGSPRRSGLREDRRREPEVAAEAPPPSSPA